MCNHKDKSRLVPKEKGYGIMIKDFQSQEFGFGFILIVTDLQTVDEYYALQPKYVDTGA